MIFFSFSSCGVLCGWELSDGIDKACDIGLIRIYYKMLWDLHSICTNYRWDKWWKQTTRRGSLEGWNLIEQKFMLFKRILDSSLKRRRTSEDLKFLENTPEDLLDPWTLEELLNHINKVSKEFWESENLRKENLSEQNSTNYLLSISHFLIQNIIS